VLGDLCKRRGGEIAAAERDDPFPVQAPAVRLASGAHVLFSSLGPASRGRATDDPKSLRAGREQQKARDGRLELELPPYAVARVDS
jgi:hypothetical protein